MLTSRLPIGYVVAVNGTEITLNINDDHRGQVAAHADGISYIGQPSDFLGIDAGSDVIVARITSIQYAEPKHAHSAGVGGMYGYEEPLRQISARSVGYLSRDAARMSFSAHEWRLPALGAAAFPLTRVEQLATVAVPEGEAAILLGHDARTGMVPVEVPLSTLLGRHLAVLGSTGQGKTNFVASLTQTLLNRLTHPRIVIFDINGEYANAFSHIQDNGLRISVVGTKEKANNDYGGKAEFLRIPYFALGRHGLGRLLLPSEKTQMPALRFSIDRLKYLQTDAEGAGLVGEKISLFDDCRGGDASDALDVISRLRDPVKLAEAEAWPHMRALSCLAADWYAIQKTKGGHERSSFLFGHVQSLVNRIRSLIDDERFRTVVDIEGGAPSNAGLNLDDEATTLINKLFGSPEDDKAFKVHVIDMSNVAQDLMPFVLGSLLELFASELFKRGPSKSHPTFLVLEEAHHYLRQLPGDSETGQQALAYERLAKEGRKFGLSLLVSTQRPSELSPTVLAQCGTWCVFRLTNEQDQRSIASATEHGGGYILKFLPGLPRGQAILLGGASPLPTVIATPEAAPKPISSDADFLVKWGIKPT